MSAFCTAGRVRLWLAAAAILILVSDPLPAQMIPLHIGTTRAVRDEYGTPLCGNIFDDPATCARVEILWATDGAFPPAADGTPDARNAPVENGVTYIGALTSPVFTNSGTFGASLRAPRPPAGALLFARAFNAPTRSAASFYADSEIITVSAEASLVYDLTFGPLQPLDASDPDEDGLNNAWEESLGGDPGNPDTDGDGMPDGFEYRAGTDLRDPNSLLRLSAMAGIGPTWLEDLGEGEFQLMMRPEDAIVAWQSVTGKQYQLEFIPDSPARGPVYDSVGVVVTATDTVTRVTIPGGLTNSALGAFRVRLVE